MKYQYWLSNIPGVGGCKTIHRLLGQAGSAEEIYFLKKEQLEKLSGLSDRQVHAITDRKKNWNLEEKYAALGESGISFLSCEMESYPKQLRNIVDAPYSLYIKGKMPDFSKRRVAGRRGENVLGIRKGNGRTNWRKTGTLWGRGFKRHGKRN